MKFENIIAALLGFVIITALLCFGLNASNSLFVEDCTLIGKTVINGKAFDCHPIKDTP